MSNFFKFILSIVMIKIIALGVHAEQTRLPKRIAYPDNVKSSFEPGNTANLKRQLVRELSGTESLPLNLPQFPRETLIQEQAHTITMTSTGGIVVPTLGPFAKVSVEARYVVKTQFFMVAHDNTYNQKSAPEPNQVVETNNKDNFLRWDEETHRNYPQVNPKNPMVGFCIYETTLVQEASSSFGFENSIFSAKKTDGESDATTLLKFSGIFELEPDISVSDYSENICNTLFVNSVKKSIENRFTNIIKEKMFHNNPNSTCSVKGHYPNDDVNGDYSCIGWHKNYSDAVRHMTIPRCEMQVDGAHRCVLKSKENMPCGLYKNPSNKQYSEFWDPSTYSIKTTDSYFEFKCDQKQGLSCQMTSKPSLIPIFKGKAKCIKKSGS